MIERISPPGVAAPRGPYSPAVRAGDFIFVSGQVAVDPATQQLISGDIAVETRQVLNNIKALLEGCGATLADVVKRSEEHTSELQSPCNLVCRLLLEKKNTETYYDARPAMYGSNTGFFTAIVAD